MLTPKCESIVKAEQSAGVLLQDLHSAVAEADSVALEMMLAEMADAVATVAVRLARLRQAEEKA